MSDAYYENVALLLPMNGADGGTTFTDYSPNRKSVAVYGNAHTEVDQYKYYGSSGYFDGSGDYLTTNSITFAGDFTVECWMYLTSLVAFNAVFDAREPLANVNYIFGVRNSSGTPRISTILSTGETTGSSQSFNLNTWVHLAWSRSGSVIKPFVNGVQDGSITYSGTITPTGSTMRIGATIDPLYITGYIQDLRVTDGVARYTADFTPPDKFCKTISGTVTGADGNPAQRTIVAVPRDFPSTRIFVGESSAVDGSYSLQVPDVECSRIVLADETTLFNDIVDRVIPG